VQKRKVCISFATVPCLCQLIHKASPTRLVSTIVPESAAFPHGLPQALEASVAVQHISEGMSSESDHSMSAVISIWTMLNVKQHPVAPVRPVVAATAALQGRALPGDARICRWIYAMITRNMPTAHRSLRSQTLHRRQIRHAPSRMCSLVLPSFDLSFQSLLRQGPVMIPLWVSPIPIPIVTTRMTTSSTVLIVGRTGLPTDQFMNKGSATTVRK
jgi:hypothetical protein